MQRRKNVSTLTSFFFTTSGGIHFLSFALVWVGKPFFCSHPTNQHQPSINHAAIHPSIAISMLLSKTTQFQFHFPTFNFTSNFQLTLLSPLIHRRMLLWQTSA